MESKRLLKKTGLYFIGNLSSKILTFLLVPLYAVYINTADLGYYDYAQTMMNVLAPIFFVAIWEAILKFYLQSDDEQQKEKILATSSVFTMAMSFVLFTALLIYNIFSPIKSLFYVIAMILSYSVMFIWQYYARSLAMNHIYVITSVIGTFVNFSANIVMICFLNMRLNALFISYILANLCIIISLEFKLRILSRIKRKNIDLSVLKKMLVFSAPLVLNLISSWLITGFGRAIINSKLGDDMNGLYAFANKFAIVITMLGSVINMAIIEEALTSAKKNGIGKDFINTIQLLFRLFQSMLIVAAPSITIFYFFIRTKDYYESLSYFPMLLLYSLIMIMTTSLGTVFQVIDKTKYQFITTVIGSAFTVIPSLLFIDSFGIYAVIFSQVCGSFVMLISRYFFVNKYVDFKINWFPVIGMLIIYCIVSWLCLNINIIAVGILFVICGLFVLFINKSYISAFFKLLKNR